jgi:hypothetical protein
VEQLPTSPVGKVEKFSYTWKDVTVDVLSPFKPALSRMMPRLIRRQPLVERIKAYLNPADFLLWLSEELESHGWDQLEKEWAIPIGLLLNLTFLVARANSYGTTGSYDDVFGDSKNGAGWFSWLVGTIMRYGR